MVETVYSIYKSALFGSMSGIQQTALSLLLTKIVSGLTGQRL